MGTWIETRETTKSDRQLFVVPLVGTWIETDECSRIRIVRNVVPLVGTWIETSVNTGFCTYKWSFPLWERGLKPMYSALAREPASVVPLVGTWIETAVRSSG